MKTIQSFQQRKASEKTLSVSRKFSKTVVTSVSEDIPLSLRLVSKDLVRALVSGSKANKKVQGRHAEVVGEDGERIKVVGRLPRLDPSGGYQVTFADENYTLGYAQPEDRPDSVYVVFYNRFRDTVDTFSLPVSTNERKALPVSSIRYSTVKKSYCSSQKYLISSVSAS